MLGRRGFLKVAAALGIGPVVGSPAHADTSPPWVASLLQAAKAQIGVTVLYDPTYVSIAYPGGDVPRDRGVCTDVVIRAYRDAFGLDLQEMVNRDMRAAFSAYPRLWGLSKPDRNIDHRRVPNLETLFRRKGWSLPLSDDPADWKPGDLFTQRLPGGQPHIGIVSDRRNAGGDRPLAIHNIGAGARMEDILFTFERVGHFRVPAAV